MRRLWAGLRVAHKSNSWMTCLTRAMNPILSSSRYDSEELKTPSSYPSVLVDDEETVFPGYSPVQVQPRSRQNRPHLATDSRSLRSEHSFPSETDDCEILENSFIWLIYNEEASKSDTSMVDASHREIDVLLVFTGLFSAVLTTLIVQVYQMMLPDPTETTNNLLNELISIQTQLLHSLVNGTTTDTPLSGQETQLKPEPSIIQIRLVNGLWFSALTCSLLTALISMLAKQWLHSYTRGITGSPRERTRIRQNRFIQFRSWHVLTLINSLPLLLHAAFFLFLSGVVILLWKEEIEVSIITLTATGLAYLFYLISMWTSFISPDCPYQHPISAHLHHWLRPGQDWYTNRVNKPADSGGSDGELAEDLSVQSVDLGSDQDCVPTTDDMLDATAFIWLLKELNNNAHVHSSALQAIVIFRRDSTALHLLRQAGASQMILKQFKSCFQPDDTLGMQWYIKDAATAGKCCQAWMRLAYQTKLSWPIQLVQPLHMLCELTDQPAVSAPAACILALTYPDENRPQVELLSLLSRHVDKQARLSWSMLQEVLDTLLEAIVTWELPAAVLVDTVSRAVPILIRLLHELGTAGSITIRHAIYLNLYALTGNFLGSDTRREEAKRKDIACHASISALSTIVQKHEYYGIEDDQLLDIVAVELSRFAKSLIIKAQAFPESLRDSAKDTLTSLYLKNRLTTKSISEDTLADILYLLHPVVLPDTEHQAIFTLDLIDTLKHHRHPIITRNVLRLLESILSSYSLSSVNAFMGGGGLNVLLQISNTGRTDGRKLQMDSLRVLCTFVYMSATLYFEDKDDFSTSFFDNIFQSDFLKTLCGVVAAGRWWLADVAELWAPTLLKLCRVRPDDPGWHNVEKTFWRYAELHQTANGWPVLIENLDRFRDLRSKMEGGAGKSFFEGGF